MSRPSTRTSSSFPAPLPGRSQAGFTLVELLVTLAILVVVILGVLALFDLNSRIARTQMHVAEMQQSQRVAQQSIVRLARMAGRGGLLPFDSASTLQLPGGVAMAVDSNVAAGVKLGNCDCARVLPGTDVLTVRGVFTTPLYNSDPLNAAAFVHPAGATGSMTLFRRTPTGAPQPLDELARVVKEVEAGEGRDALLLVNSLGQYVVMEITGGTVTDGDTSVGEDPGVASVRVDLVEQGGTHTTAYRQLSQGGTVPPSFGQVTFAGLLEEYRFYVRDRRVNPADLSEEVVPELVRARFHPNTDTAYRSSDANLTEVIAENILDLQVSIGVDLDADGAILEGTDDGATGSVARTADEWLFNAAGDDPDPTLWNVPGARLFYMRLTTLARTDRPTPKYQADPLGTIEDKDYSQGDFTRFNTFAERTYPRREIQTTLDLRNL